ncbi:MAG TPA: hypothetical protein VGT40_14950 [Methylomirabilota bacterium]|jgi:hypothetical protein|nr:hypothetical protein [Methylomirabilota bacterium]
MNGRSMAGLGTSVALVFIALVAAGCASIVKGADQRVSFRSEPSEARVVITDVREGKEIQVGSTPFTASLKRGAGYFKKAKYSVTFDKPGYKTEAVALEGTPGGWYLGGNFLFGGGMGWLIVDPATGAMWTLEPGDVSVTLKKDQALGLRDEGLTIALRADVPAELASKLKPINPAASRH